MNQKDLFMMFCDHLIIHGIGFDRCEVNTDCYTHVVDLPNYKICFNVVVFGGRRINEVLLIYKVDGQVWNRRFSWRDFVFVLRAYQKYIQLRLIHTPNEEDMKFVCEIKYLLTGE